MSAERKGNFAGHVFDTYAWIDYLAGGKAADKVANLLNNPSGRMVTPATAIAELTEKLLREGVEEEEIRHVVKFIGGRTEIFACDEQVAFHAGELNFTQKKKVKDWGMLDSLNYAVARMLNCVFVTGDPHFKDLRKDVVFLR